MTATSSEISQRIASLDTLAADLGADFDKAAMEAVSGVDGAGVKAAEINQRIERLAVDRRILSRALDRALSAEAAAAEAEAEAKRQGHIADARAHAVALLDASKRADAAILALFTTLDDVTRAEMAVRQALGRAREPYGDGVMWRSGLNGLAIEHIRRFTDGRSRYQEAPRSLADAAGHAWSFLLDDNEARNG